MKYKQFVLDAIRNNIDPPIDNDQELLLMYAIISFQDTGDVPKSCCVSNPDENVELFIKRMAECSIDEARENLLLALADFLDGMASKNRFWFLIPHDRIYVSDHDQIVFNWNERENYSAVDTKRMVPEIKRKYQDMLSHQLNSGIITVKQLNARTTHEAFVLFLLKTLYPQLPPQYKLPSIYWLNVALTKIGMSPEEKYFLCELLHSKKSYLSCRDIVKSLFKRRRNSICSPKKPMDLLWDAGFHTEHGRNKGSIQNEDSYHVLTLKDNRSSLFMVADGVSTANVGSGKLASISIMEVIEEQKQSLMMFMEEASEMDSDRWAEACRDKILEIFGSANVSCVERLNRYMQMPRPSGEPVQPMSSTVVMGFVDKNRGIFGHLGDSHVFYIQKGNLMRLNEEHNSLADRIAQYIDHPDMKPFQTQREDRHLERVLPMTEYDEDGKEFVPVDLKERISFMRFYPEADCALVAATDGLIDSLGTSSNEFENEQDILTAYLEAEKSISTPMEIARRIGRKADEAAGTDNITLVLLKSRKQGVTEGESLAPAPVDPKPWKPIQKTQEA